MGRRLHRSLLGPLGLAVAFSVGFGGCFIEPAIPGNFRFQCSSDSECLEGEVCADGLCQAPCGGEMDLECGGVCLHGYCSGLCSLADNNCSKPQECISLVPPGEETDEVLPGVCVVKCGDDNPCGEGQACYEDLGLCVGTCMTDDDCGMGEACTVGFCVPSFN